MSNAALYILTVVIWGSTWIAINFQLGEVPPEVSLVYRCGLAAAILFAWCAAKGIRLKFNLKAHVRFAQLGVLLFGLNYIATYSAQQYISSALNAVAFSTMVWMNILNARLFFGTRLEASVIAGASLGVLGVVVLFWPEIQGYQVGDRSLYGAMLCLGGALLASLGNMVSQRSQKLKLPVVASNAWGMAYGAVFCAVVALRQGHPFVFEMSLPYVSSLLFLALFGSVIAFGCYLTLLGRIGAHRAGYVVVLFPVVAVVLSMAFEGLTLEWHLLVGIALVLIGNAVILGKDRWPRLRLRASRAEPEHT
jgi:drug/metabolite transporter (DMT)-like permease